MLGWLSAGSERGREVIRPLRATASRPEVQLDYVGSLANAARVIGRLHRGEKRLVFCDSRSRVEQLALLLREREVETFVSHSSLGADERRLAEQAFANRQNCVIVATSSLELGIDVGDLDRVIQIDAPATVSSFLQRMGRTGRRAGQRHELPVPGDGRRGTAPGRRPRAALGARATSSPCRPRPSRTTSWPSN